VVALVAACSGDDDRSGEATTEGAIELAAETPERCEFIADGGHCLLPFPSDWFTVEDAATDTGRRIDLDVASMPVNVEGTPVDPTEINRNDGFSPGTPIMVEVPGVDLEAEGIATIRDLGASLDEDAPIVLLDAETGERHPYWAELDAQADPGTEPTLLIRPAAALLEGHRYVVALRGLDRDAPDGFRAYRDRLDSGDEVVEGRREHFEDLFATLDEAGVARDDLYLAWDFTVASRRNLSERLLHMRDDAFAALGDAAPGFTVDRVTGGGGEPSTVSGTYEVPRYLTGEGEPGTVLNNGDGAGSDPLPERNGTQIARYLCFVPAAATAESPSALALYGHGLLGSAEEVLGAAPAVAEEHDITFCATDWIGMSAGDVPNVAQILGDVSRFRSLADRLQQGILNFLFLGRLMIHEDGFAAHPAFQDGGQPVIDRDVLVFNGNSQGGILGGATTAVAQDWTRAVLGVPAMNYSTLLQRSIDFDDYGVLLENAYPNELDRLIGFAYIQMLWDRGENQGYAQHLTRDPYPDTPEHDVLLFEAFGDHQVANVATEVMARTIGAAVRQPALEEGRSTAVEPMWGLDPVEDYPYGGSALVIWDFGTPAPPDANIPPRDGEDPHGKGGEVEAVRRMAAEFLLGDGLIDVCDGQPCRSPG
jgi:hypothetical protein